MNDKHKTLVCVSVFAIVFFAMILLNCLLSAGGSGNELILLACASLVPLLQISKYKINSPLVLVGSCFLVSFSTVLIDMFYPDVFRWAFCGPISFVVTFGSFYLKLGGLRSIVSTDDA